MSVPLSDAEMDGGRDSPPLESSQLSALGIWRFLTYHLSRSGISYPSVDHALESIDAPNAETVMLESLNKGTVQNALNIFCSAWGVAVEQQIIHESNRSEPSVELRNSCGVCMSSSLCRQRDISGSYGRLGVSFPHSRKRDFIFLQTMSKILGSGRSESSSILRDSDVLLNDHAWNTIEGESREMLEAGEKEEDALTRARMAVGERLLQIGNARERNEG